MRARWTETEVERERGALYAWESEGDLAGTRIVW